MAPCYNYSTRNLHYRTQSLPEAVYNNHMLSVQLGQAEYHAQDKLHAMALHHHSQAIKKKVSLKRSQTNACDLILPSSQHHQIQQHQQHHLHRPAPLTAGVYEAFLPPPNLNAVGLPVNANSGYHRSSRTHSFYMPSNNVSTQSSSHQNLNMMGSHQNLSNASRSDHMQANGYQSVNLPGSKPYSSHQTPTSARNGGGELFVNTSDKYPSMPFNFYHHRSVPNISAPAAAAPPPLTSSASNSSLTTPLFVDCSVEYDLGDHPPVPANSEPLLSIHPEYVMKSTRTINSSPYSLYPQNTNHIRSSKIKGVSPKIDINETPKKGSSAIAAGNSDLQCLVNSNNSVRRQLHPGHQLHGGQAAARYNIATRRAAAVAAAQQQQQQVAAVHHQQQSEAAQRLHHSGGSNFQVSNLVKQSAAMMGSSSLDLMAASSAANKLDATRKLSVESWDSGIGLMSNGSSHNENRGMMNSADGSNISCSWLTQQFGSNSQQQQQQSHSLSCDTNNVTNSTASMSSHSQFPPTYSSAVAAGCGSHYQRSLPHHHHNQQEILSSAGKQMNINNNNNSSNKKFAFGGEYHWNCFLFC